MFTFTSTWFGSNLFKVTKSIVLFGRYNCIVYGPNHFLVNFARCVFYSFGNQSTWSPNFNYFFVYFYCLHRTWFHYWFLTISSTCSLSIYSFSNSINMLVNTLIGFASSWSPQNASRTYFTTRNSVFFNQSLCNWHATSCHLQLSWWCLQL